MRVYTWADGRYPLWARACAYAETLGLEDRMFEELVRARSDRPEEIYAAARRAGIDPSALRREAGDPTPPARLVRDRRRVVAARLEVLPTIDVGRRRLLGEQSLAELREALSAARAEAR
jgi:2-hydroxychromene-2-carboxylate isomerase